jgi:hypothetical protein
MVAPVAPEIEARALARASAAWTPPSAGRLFGRSSWVLAVAAGVVLALGAGAYAARAWIEPGTTGGGAPPRTSEPRPPVVVSAPAAHGAPATIAPPVVPHVRRAPGRSSAPPPAPTNAELELLRAARQDVLRGDFVGAQVVIAEHTRRFRNGGLVEEREALRVKSLIGLGRREEAKRAAAAFHARFPHSVFLPTFERLNGADR